MEKEIRAHDGRLSMFIACKKNQKTKMSPHQVMSLVTLMLLENLSMITFYTITILFLW